MAQDKRGFVLYTDLIFTVNKMKDAKAGELFKTILSYVNDENPTVKDATIDLVFEPIKQQLKRDLKKYEQKKKQWSEAGIKSAEAKKLTKLNGIQQPLTDVEERSTESTVIVRDTVSVKVNVISKVDQWISDLENGSHIIDIARKTETPLQYFKDRISHFKKAANLNYVDHYKFLDHFKNWSLQNTNIIPVQSGSSIKLGRK